MATFYNPFTQREIDSIAETPLHFHIGRGGHFHNPGHVSFEGEREFSDLVSSNDWLFDGPNGEIMDDNGNIVSDDGWADKYGRIEYDGDYNTDYVIAASDCGDRERNAISEAYERSEYELDENLAAFLYSIDVLDIREITDIYELITDYIAGSEIDIEEFIDDEDDAAEARHLIHECSIEFDNAEFDKEGCGEEVDLFDYYQALVAIQIYNKYIR